MKLSYLALLIVLVMAGASVSGCCCCAGMDNFLGKFQKSVDNVQLPRTLNVNGTTYELVGTTTFKTQQDCVDKFIANCHDEGIKTDGYEGLISAGAQLSGIYEAKEFVYQAPDGSRIKGFVGRSGSPGQLSGTMSVATQLVAAVGTIGAGASPGLGEESGSYSTEMPNHKTGYATTARDSNVLVYAYTYSSPDAATAAVSAALQAANAAI